MIYKDQLKDCDCRICRIFEEWKETEESIELGMSFRLIGDSVLHKKKQIVKLRTSLEEFYMPVVANTAMNSSIWIGLVFGEEIRS